MCLWRIDKLRSRSPSPSPTDVNVNAPGTIRSLLFANSVYRVLNVLHDRHMRVGQRFRPGKGLMPLIETRLERFTICRCHFKGITFSRVIYRPTLWVRPGFKPVAFRSVDRHLSDWANRGPGGGLTAIDLRWQRAKERGNVILLTLTALWKVWTHYKEVEQLLECLPTQQIVSVKTNFSLTDDAYLSDWHGYQPARGLFGTSLQCNSFIKGSLTW